MLWDWYRTYPPEDFTVKFVSNQRLETPSESGSRFKPPFNTQISNGYGLWPDSRSITRWSMEDATSNTWEKRTIHPKFNLSNDVPLKKLNKSILLHLSSFLIPVQSHRSHGDPRPSWNAGKRDRGDRSSGAKSYRWKRTLGQGFAPARYLQLKNHLRLYNGEFYTKKN